MLYFFFKFYGFIAFLLSLIMLPNKPAVEVFDAMALINNDVLPVHGIHASLISHANLIGCDYHRES